MSWLFPAALIHSLLPAIWANIVLKMTFSGLLSWAWGFIGWRVGGKSVATTGVLLAVFAPQVIIALHGDYTDTAFLVYSALAVAFIFGAATSKHAWLWMIGVGVALTFTGLANIGILTFVGVGIVLFHLMWIPGTFLTQLLRLAGYVCTAAATIGILQWIHYKMGGNEFLFAAQIRLANILNTEGTANEWFIPGWDWAVQATQLVLPASAVFGGAAYLFTSKRWYSESNHAILSLLAGLCMSLMIAGYLQFRGTMALSSFYYSVAFLSLSIPLLLALLGKFSLSETASKWWSLFTAGALAFVALVPWPMLYSKGFLWWRTIWGDSEAFLFGSWGIISIAAALLLGVRNRFSFIRRIHPTIYLVAVVYLSMPRTFPHFSYSDRLQQRYSAIYQATQYLQETTEQKPLFWINPDFDDAWSLASVHIYGFSLYTMDPFPEVSDPFLTPSPVVLAVEPGKGEEALVAAQDRLARSGFSVENLKTKRIDANDGIGFDLLVFDVGLLPIDPASPPADIKPLQIISALEYSGEHSYLKELGFFNHNGGHVSIQTTDHVARFVRTTPIDYAFTHWRELPKTGHSRHLIIEFYFNHGGHTKVAIEDEHLRQFHIMDFTEPGRHVRQLPVPNDSKFFRFRFYSPTEESAPLPTNIIIHEAPK
ncbi:hypothetical protein [Actomonas aquatica]|uniref:Glycosyltransferase RgtA/B/C/D-like domain-containing protein n=1 Tax=Actomonas aquatica TaxID=2866162 RepID=A0ABZ1CAF3_9BACT|nr:hypothetical protein [Opitutus sp. WL0086]WRQ88488.1 hypothetical protein K1X11_003675 [Opitutus sp. WL0086]